MEADASIYSNVQNPVANQPSVLDRAEGMMRLSNLGMQQAQMGYQMRQNMATQSAIAKNTDPHTGQLNREGFLSDLGKMAPMAAMQYGEHFAKADKDAAEAKIAQMQQAHQTLGLTLPALSYLRNLPENQAAQEFPGVISQLKAQGVPTANVPPAWDRNWADQAHTIGMRTKEGLENQLTQANIAKTQSEAGNIEKNRLADYQKMLNSDEVYKKATNMISEGNGALNTIQDALKNPGSASNAPLMIARYASGGQRLNETEMEYQQRVGSVADRLRQKIETAENGTLTPKSAAYLSQFIQTGMGSALQNKASAEKRIAGQYAVNSGIPHDLAYMRLTANSPSSQDGSMPNSDQNMPNTRPEPGSAYAASPSNSKNTTNSQDMSSVVKMKGPDGKIRVIPIAMKSEAIAAGGKVVK